MSFEDVYGIPEVNAISTKSGVLESILERGRVFHRRDVNEQDCQVSLALQDALAYAGPNGFVATMPELIAARVAVAVPTGDPAQPYAMDHWLWKHWYTAHSEENVGPNYTRQFYPEEDYVVVVVHGGGLLSPERIRQAYADGLVHGAARYTPEEFRGLLRGQLPDGAVPLFSLEDALVQQLPRRCGIVLPYSRVPGEYLVRLLKREFLEHPLVIARNAGVQHLEEYFNRVNGRDEQIIYHLSAHMDPYIPRGRVLLLHGLYSLLGVYSAGPLGHFVGVRR